MIGKKIGKNLINIALVAAIFFVAQESYAACGGGAGGNPLAQIPNLAPSTPAVPVSSAPPGALELDKKVTSATAVAAPTPPAPIGKVVWVKGKLQAIAPDKTVRELQDGSIIYQHDVLVTPKGSQAQVVFSDHTMMTFRENTKLYINKYEFDPAAQKGSVGKSVMDLIEGGYRTITGKIAKSNPSDYQVKTEVATIGVRGTDYVANIQACKLLMKNNEGTPLVTNEKGTLVLTKDSPYASVDVNQAPITIKTQPAVFNEPLVIVPVKAFVPPTTTPMPTKVRSDDVTNVTHIIEPTDNTPQGGIGAGGGSGGSAGNCGPAASPSTGNFNVKFK